MPRKWRGIWAELNSVWIPGLQSEIADCCLGRHHILYLVEVRVKNRMRIVHGYFIGIRFLVAATFIHAVEGLRITE